MPAATYRLSYPECLATLLQRLAEPAPAKIQLLSGPRQVGKTTLLLELAERLGEGHSIYFAMDGPEAAFPGAWERLWVQAESVARTRGRVVLFLDEIHALPNWAARLKGEWDRLKRKRIAVHVVATGSAALHLGIGSKESLAGRFERLVLGHWTAAALVKVFNLSGQEAAEQMVRQGSYPGAMAYRKDLPRWLAYVRESILEPAIGRDLIALSAVRKPGLLRQVFGVCVHSPAQIVSLQKIQGQLQERGALETIAHYLHLLEDSYLVAALSKYSTTGARQRAAPPKLVTLSNALLAVSDPLGIPEAARNPARFGAWVENACLAHAWMSAQQLQYWREEPYDVDAVMEGSWGRWALEIKTGPLRADELKGLAEFTGRHRRYQPLVICDPPSIPTVQRAGMQAVGWPAFLLYGLPQALEQGGGLA